VVPQTSIPKAPTSLYPSRLFAILVNDFIGSSRAAPSRLRRVSNRRWINCVHPPSPQPRCGATVHFVIPSEAEGSAVFPFSNEGWTNSVHPTPPPSRCGATLHFVIPSEAEGSAVSPSQTTSLSTTRPASGSTRPPTGVRLLRDLYLKLCSFAEIPSAAHTTPKACNMSSSPGLN
jgi:hypothetical protein